jgi:diguanylate cyclase (GGDEF)-like protein
MARFGFADLNEMVRGAADTAQELQRFAAEAVFLYSCVCRRFVLQQDIQVETHCIQQVAPSAGFFGYGEFGRQGRRLQLFNSTLVTVAMREGPPRRVRAWRQDDVASLMDRHRVRNARVTSRLLDVITALSAELEQSNRLLHFQAEHDSLTGALNRQGFTARLTAEIRRAIRYRRPLSIAMFDLDHFKRFNDTHGHAAGDHVLKSAVACVNDRLRQSDMLCRYGGEEFVLVLPETALDEAVLAAEGARAAIASLSLVFDGRKLPPVTASFGVASLPERCLDSSIGPFIKAADLALYRSKASGRDCVSSSEQAA